MTEPELLGSVDRSAGTVRLERTFAAPPAEVWSALTDPSRLADWLGPLAGGLPGPDQVFVLQLSADESAACRVITWDPESELRLVWDYTGEGPSEVAFMLDGDGDRTNLTLIHTKLSVDPVQYGAGWHVGLDQLAAHLTGAAPHADFMAAYRDLEPRYADAALPR